jgi:hypothetical protein
VARKRLRRGKAVKDLENAETRTRISRDVDDADLLASSRPSPVAVLCNLLGKSNLT